MCGVGNDPCHTGLWIDRDHRGATRIGDHDLLIAHDRNAHGVEQRTGCESVGLVDDGTIALGWVDRENGALPEVEDKQLSCAKRHIDRHDQCRTGAGLRA